MSYEVCIIITSVVADEIFSRVLIGALPLLSIKREDRNVDVLVNKLLEFLAVEGKLTCEPITLCLK